MNVLGWLLLIMFGALGIFVMVLIAQAIVFTFAYAIKVRWVAWRKSRRRWSLGAVA